MAVKPFAFVLMPFSRDFDDVYKLGIQATCDEEGVIAERVDEQSFSETILERIYRQIQVCDFIIADMSGRNPNVFYEVGYAHAQGKLCTLLTTNTNDIPFDLKHHRHIVYDGSIHKLKTSLKNEIAWLKSEIEQRKSQSLTMSIARSYGDLERLDWAALGKIELEFEIKNTSLRRSPEIESIYIFTKKDWSFKADGTPLSKSEIEGRDAKYSALIKPPVTRLSPGAWARFKLSGQRYLWYKSSGEEPKEKYTYSGPIQFEIHTSEGVHPMTVEVSTTFEEVPF